MSEIWTNYRIAGLLEENANKGPDFGVESKGMDILHMLISLS
jgi:hypothetical protein